MVTILILYWIFSLFGNAFIFWLSYLTYKKWRKKGQNAMMADIYLNAVWTPKIRNSAKKIKVFLPAILIYVFISPFLFPILLVVEAMSLIIKLRKKKKPVNEAQGDSINEDGQGIPDFDETDWMEEINEAFPDSVLPPVEDKNDESKPT